MKTSLDCTTLQNQNSFFLFVYIITKCRLTKLTIHKTCRLTKLTIHKTCRLTKLTLHKTFRHNKQLKNFEFELAHAVLLRKF